MSGRLKICYVVSLVEKSMPLEWVAKHLSVKYDLTFIMLNPTIPAMARFLESQNIRWVHIRYRGKRSIPLALWRLIRHFRKEHVNVVHTHLMDATLVGLTAAWLAGVGKRIYTRHNSTYHQNYFPRSVKIDKWCNRMATRIVSLSQATDYALAVEGVAAEKIRKIPHGFNFTALTHTDARMIDLVQKKWNIPNTHPRIGAVARLIEWKGVQFIVEAFRELLHDYPDAVLILANAQGPYASMIRAILSDIPSERVVQISFEEDIASVYRLMDVFVHTPIDPYCEAFGQTYIEAWSLGLPSVVTISGIAAEVARHKENAWIVGYKDSKGVLEGLRALLSDQGLRERIGLQAREDVIRRFEIDKSMSSLEKVYDE